MALADLDDFKRTLSAGPEIVTFQQPQSTVLAGRPYDTWLTAPPVGTFPAAAVAPTRATAGAFGQQNGGSGALVITGARYNAGFSSGLYLVIDRLSHTGGLVGNVTTAQTTNLPTAALTRYTSGEGVMMALVMSTVVVGTTATTVSATYTNQAGTGSRVSPLVAFGGTGFRESNRVFFLPLQEGDSGVRSVQSVTVTATTGTAGNFGVLLFKPLYAIVVDNNSGVTVGDYVTGNTSGGIPEIVDDACLSVLTIMAGGNNGGTGSILISEV
jgi:hypothetical protein